MASELTSVADFLDDLVDQIMLFRDMTARLGARHNDPALKQLAIQFQRFHDKVINLRKLINGNPSA